MSWYNFAFSCLLLTNVRVRSLVLLSFSSLHLQYSARVCSRVTKLLIRSPGLGVVVRKVWQACVMFSSAESVQLGRLLGSCSLCLYCEKFCVFHCQQGEVVRHVVRIHCARLSIFVVADSPTVSNSLGASPCKHTAVLSLKSKCRSSSYRTLSNMHSWF